MVAQQRHAVFNLSIAFSSLSLFIALIPFLGVAKAQAGFALLAISALGPLFMRKREGQIITDERDRAILLRATQITFAVFWLLFVAGMMAAYYAFRNNHAVPVDTLPLVLWLGWAILLAVHSMILLVLYHRS